MGAAVQWARVLTSLVWLLLAVTPVEAADLTISGSKLSLVASQKRPAGRRFAFVSEDAAIAPPFTDPAAGAHLLVNASAEPGNCYAEIPLDPSKWKPIGGDGTSRGYRYRADPPGTHGIRTILIKSGKIKVTGRGSNWPCDLSAASQNMPITVTLRTGSTRYCAAFGGTVKENGAGKFRAFDASAPSACPKQDITAAQLNILHGFTCNDGDHCRVEDRVALLFQWVAARGCPDIVTLEEVIARPAEMMLPLLEAHRLTACPFPYTLAYSDQPNTFDDEVVLSRYPVVSAHAQPLFLGFRHVFFVRIDHPLGPLDVFVTHLASSSDGAQLACGATCPPECVAAGAATVRECQGVQVGNFVAAQHDGSMPAIVAGDFNESPGTFVYDQITGHGWTDVYLAAGNPECDTFTGIGCTSGRQDETLTDLESPASNENERIDYIFLVPPTSPICAAALDPPTDDDADGTATRHWADQPNPFAPMCGPLPDPICWPSDHEGVELDLNCG